MLTEWNRVLYYRDRDVKELGFDSNCPWDRQPERSKVLTLVTVIESMGSIVKIGLQWRMYGNEMRVEAL